MAKSASEVTKKWVQRTSGATQAYREGVMGVTEAPGKSAARAVDRMIQKLIEARDSGDLQKAMESVSLEEWKRLTSEKGASRLASGVQAAEGKMQKHMSNFLPFVESVKQSLPPRGTLQENLQRMMENAQKLSEYKKPR